MLTKAIPDLRLFWTAYDPLDLVGDSIDVLGLQGSYVVLADRLLPGFTTLTAYPRYVSMLCAAIELAEGEFPETGEPLTRLRHKRLTAVQSYERAWALACGLAAQDVSIGKEAVQGLRGIRYVRRRLSELSGREKTIRTNSFNLLADQLRYGGFGMYSGMLEACHLASMRAVTLRPLGKELAEAFSSPGPALPVWDEDRPLSIEKLREWGAQCHLGQFSREEAQILARALRGGEEREWDDAIRWTTLQMLARYNEDGISEPELLDRLHAGIRDGSVDRLKAPVPCVRQIEAALVLIQPYERFCQIVQFLFDAMRSAATDEAEVLLSRIASARLLRSGYSRACSAASELVRALDQANKIDSGTFQHFRNTLDKSGILALAEAIRRAVDVEELLILILERHRAVQQGRFDDGRPKAPWIRYHPSKGSLCLTAQRFRIAPSERRNHWEEVPWHSYRTFAALRFVQACSIR